MRKALQRQAHQSQTPTRELSPQTARLNAPQHNFNFSEIDIFPKSAQGAHVNGAGIAEGLRAQMEASFQSDFSGLKIFEDHSASSIHAKAYAQGEHLYFAPGRFDPSSQAGLELLGHELAHVVQQRQGVAPNPLVGASATAMTGLPPTMPWSQINTDRALEREADTLGRQAARGERASVAPRSGGALSATGAAVIQASPEDETRLHEDLEKRANSVWQSHGSPQNQDEFARVADWGVAQGQQKSEIERRANLEYHKRFTADASHNVSAPAHSDEKMTEDYFKGEAGFKRELRNRERAANPTNTKGVALTTSGEYDNIGRSAAAATFTEIEQHTPDPSNPGKLLETRRDTLKAQLDGTGRANIMLPPTKIAPIDSNLKNTDPIKYKDDLEGLGWERSSGVQENVVKRHLHKYLEANSDNAKSTNNQAPLAHAHSAHGFHIPAVHQIERKLYGIRPDERGTGSDPLMLTSNTPNGSITLPKGMSKLNGKAKNPKEQAEFDAIKSVSSFPQITEDQAKMNLNYNPLNSQTPRQTLSGKPLKYRKDNLGFNVGDGSTASGFTSALAEHNSLSQNFAQAWQSKDKSEFTPAQTVAATNPNAPRVNLNVAVTSENIGNPLNSTHANATKWKPEEYGRGFEFANYIPELGLDRSESDDLRASKTVARAEAIQVERQTSSKTILKKVLDDQERKNGFDVVTNYPNNDPSGVTKKGTTTVNVDSTFKPQERNDRDEQADLTDSRARIGTSTTGNIPYKRDTLGKLVTDPTTGNPLPQLDSNGKPIKQRF